MTTRETKPRWHFIRRRPSSGKARNSQVEKFFRSEEVQDKANAVIREGIQNSLDAALVVDDSRSRSVNIVITFGECPPEAAQVYFPGLWDHLKAVEDTLDSIPAETEPVRFLAFEDFNTTGLVGRTDEWDPPDNKNAFFNFFRGEGVTEKEGNQRGRHGVGKMVFSIASRARSIFGLTATANSTPALMGASTLSLHKAQGNSYDPDGWFGNLLPVDEDKLVVPINDENLISRFADSFSLHRDTLPGLSVVVPWLHHSVTREATIHSVLRGFYWPILLKQLHVEAHDHQQESILISGDSICSVAETTPAPDGYDADEVQQTLHFARWAQQQSDIIRAECPDGNAQHWKKELIEESKRKELRALLDQEKPIAIELPIRIRLKKSKAREAMQASFRVFIQPDANCTDGNVQFIREGLVISGVKCRRPPSRYRALVIIDEGPLAEFLGDAENPSHTVWQSTSVKEKYSFHDSCLKYVIQSVPNILTSLYDQENSADATLLLDLFSLPAEQSLVPEKPLPGKKKKREKETVPEDVKVEGTRPKSFLLTKRTDGFVIRRGETKAPAPRFIEVRAAYAVRKGQALKKYSPSDFDFAGRELGVNVTGGTIQANEHNQLRVAISDADFEITVTGFDRNRDLFVDAKPEFDPIDEGDDAANA